MADIAAGDVTYTILNRRKLGDSRNLNRVRMAFGDGNLTYPANGIPISKGKMGCPVVIESMVIVDQGTSGYKFQYDQSAEKLVIMQSASVGAHTHVVASASHTHNLKIISNQAAASTDAVSAKTATLGKESGTDITIAGANSATLGGVVSTEVASTATTSNGAVSAAAMSEASAVAIAAQTIEAEVIGW